MKACATKETVDRRVAAQLALPVTMVEVVTAEFLMNASALLAEYGAIDLDKFGSFWVKANGRLALGIQMEESPFMARAITERNEEVPYAEVRSGRIEDP